MTYGMSGRPTQRELKTASQARRKLERQAEMMERMGREIPHALERQLTQALALEAHLTMLRGGSR
jgi:hypothetical protein